MNQDEAARRTHFFREFRAASDIQGNPGRLRVALTYSELLKRSSSANDDQKDDARTHRWQIGRNGSWGRQVRAARFWIGLMTGLCGLLAVGEIYARYQPAADIIPFLGERSSLSGPFRSDPQLGAD